VGAVVVVLVVAGTLIALVAGTRTTGSPSTSASPGGNAAAAAGTSRSNPAPLGMSVTPAKDWTVSVASAQLQGDATMKAENIFVSPNSGKQFVIVRVSLTNRSEQMGTTAGHVKLKLLSPGGVATDASWARPPDHLDVAAQLQPGSTLTGNLAFEVPRADAVGSVLLAEPAFTLTQDQDQRFLALS
jgi:hypothetical protein